MATSTCQGWQDLICGVWKEVNRAIDEKEIGAARMQAPVMQQIALALQAPSNEMVGPRRTELAKVPVKDLKVKFTDAQDHVA
jgi:hypothetical protein